MYTEVQLKTIRYAAQRNIKIVFLDLVKEMLKVPWAKDLNEESLILVDKEYILSDYEENEADIVYRANIDGKEVFFYTLLEFQSSVDYRMPLRLFQEYFY